MMALACFPFIIAFGARWNLVSFITGVSYEKLQGKLSLKYPGE